MRPLPAAVLTILTCVRALLAPTTRATTRAAPLHAFKAALLFDCDGVLVETEELHRLAYNEAFAAFGLETGRAAARSSGAFRRGRGAARRRSLAKDGSLAVTSRAVAAVPPRIRTIEFRRAASRPTSRARRPRRARRRRTGRVERRLLRQAAEHRGFARRADYPRGTLDRSVRTLELGRRALESPVVGSSAASPRPARGERRGQRRRSRVRSFAGAPGGGCDGAGVATPRSPSRPRRGHAEESVAAAPRPRRGHMPRSPSRRRRGRDVTIPRSGGAAAAT